MIHSSRRPHASCFLLKRVFGNSPDMSFGIIFGGPLVPEVQPALNVRVIFQPLRHGSLFEEFVIMDPTRGGVAHMKNDFLPGHDELGFDCKGFLLPGMVLFPSLFLLRPVDALLGGINQHFVEIGDHFSQFLEGTDPFPALPDNDSATKETTHFLNDPADRGFINSKEVLQEQVRWVQLGVDAVHKETVFQGRELQFTSAAGLALTVALQAQRPGLFPVFPDSLRELLELGHCKPSEIVEVPWP